MERLTVMTDKGAALVMGGPYESEQAVRADLMERYKVAVARLAAYEDTGWTPEDISEKKAMLKERFVRLMSQELGMTQECLRDIVAAHLDGRLVVLPKPHGCPRGYMGPYFECPKCGGHHIKWVADFDLSVCMECGWDSHEKSVESLIALIRSGELNISILSDPHYWMDTQAKRREGCINARRTRCAR